MRVCGVSGLSNSTNISKKKIRKNADYKDIHTDVVSFRSNPFKFKNKLLKNIAITSLLSTPVTGPVGIGMAAGAYIADRLNNEGDDTNSETKNGDNK